MAVPLRDDRLAASARRAGEATAQSVRAARERVAPLVVAALVLAMLARDTGALRRLDGVVPIVGLTLALVGGSSRSAMSRFGGRERTPRPKPTSHEHRGRARAAAINATRRGGRGCSTDGLAGQELARPCPRAVFSSARSLSSCSPTWSRPWSRSARFGWCGTGLGLPRHGRLGGGEAWTVLWPAGVPVCLIAEIIFVTPLLVGFSRYRWRWLNGWTACGIGFLVAFLPVFAFDASPAGGEVVDGVVVGGGGWISLLLGAAPGGSQASRTALMFRLIAVRTETLSQTRALHLRLSGRGGRSRRLGRGSGSSTRGGLAMEGWRTGMVQPIESAIAPMPAVHCAHRAETVRAKRPARERQRGQATFPGTGAGWGSSSTGSWTPVPRRRARSRGPTTTGDFRE